MVLQIIIIYAVMFKIFLIIFRDSYCVKSVHIRSCHKVSSRIWTEYAEIQNISPYSVRMRENTDQNNSEYGHFSRSFI